MLGRVLHILSGLPLLEQVIEPTARFLVGWIAEPFFRLLRWSLVHIAGWTDLDRQFEADLRQWVQGALALLAVTRNVEQTVFGWVPLFVQGREQWLTVGLRMMLAIGIVHAMPHVRLFTFLQPSHLRLVWDGEAPYWRQLRDQLPDYLRRLARLHLSRLSLMTAILAVLAPGWLGWLCYSLSIGLCLLISLMITPEGLRLAIAHLERTARWLPHPGTMKVAAHSNEIHQDHKGPAVVTGRSYQPH